MMGAPLTSEERKALRCERSRARYRERADIKKAMEEKLDVFEGALPTAEEYENFTDQELENIAQAFSQLKSLFLEPLCRIGSPKYQVAHFFERCGSAAWLVANDREKKREKQQRQEERDARKAMKGKKTRPVAPCSGGIVIPFPNTRKTA